MMNGQGTYTLANGSVYQGNFKDGLFHGQGTYYFANGSKYVGEWKNNKREGYGTYTVGKSVIKGIWKNDEYVKTKKK